ncbi:BBE domain-containing protein [Streptomyces venezuelae]|uniref:BBE domain-containing protein n=1 Tax=Streptomyces venezuelae TaxID=54571 RepID=UPI00378E3F49
MLHPTTPDTDFGDPQWNPTDERWSTPYYKDAYPALQAVEKHWDLRHVFRHSQSIEPADHTAPQPPHLP